MLRRKTQIKQSVLELTLQADKFLEAWGFPVDAAHRKLFASYIQLVPGHKDYFYQNEAATYMRKAIANEAAFFVMNPKHYEQYLEMKKKEAADDAKAAEGTPSSVGETAQG